jgi:hypothetical protein
MLVFRRSPLYCVTVLVLLSFGIGAATAVFSIFNALILRSLPVWKPDRLVAISAIYRQGRSVPFSYPMFEELGRSQRAFEDVFGWSGIVSATVEINDKPSLVNVQTVSGNYFPALRVNPQAGRLFSLSDQRGHISSSVAVLSDAFWAEHFARNPEVIGQPIRIEGTVFTIVGITPKWFAGMTTGSAPDIRIPIGAARLNDLDSRSSLWVFVGGRLKEGATVDQARSQILSFWPRLLSETVPTKSTGRRRSAFLNLRLELSAAARGVNVELRSHLLTPLSILMGNVILMLLTVCVNLASVTLARANSSRSDIAIRQALGADRWQSVRQLVLDTLTLSTLGALLALPLAYSVSAFVVRYIAQGSLTGILLDVRPDWRVLSFGGQRRSSRLPSSVFIRLGLFPGRILAVRSAKGIAVLRRLVPKYSRRP